MDSESAKLFTEFLNGSNDAATHIFDRYVARLLALAQFQLSPALRTRVDAEDIVQSAYRSFFRKAGDGQISLQRSGDLWRILAAFTRNKARGRVERELAGKRDPRRQSRLPDLMEDGPSPEEVAIVVELLTSFMGSLKPRDRKILELRLRGETVDAIVDALANPDSASQDAPISVSTATVRRVLREAKRSLERTLFDS